MRFLFSYEYPLTSFFEYTAIPVYNNKAPADDLARGVFW